MAVTGPGTVLAMRALGLGDLCTALPALRGLRRAFPAHQLVLAGPAWADELLGGCAIDRVESAVGPELAQHTVDQLRGEVAVAVNLHGRGPASTRSLRRLRSPRMIAFRGPGAPAWCGPEWRPHEHEVARWCRLLSYWSVDTDPLDLRLTPPARPPWLAARTVLLHPGAAAPARRWPTDRWASVARALLDDGLRVLVTGSTEEQARCHLIADAATRHRDPGPDVLAGRTTMAELAALVAHVELVISNDTGVAHLATAYATPSVVLFGPTPPAEWGPCTGGPHLALWAGRRGDPHGATTFPGLLEIGVDDVVGTARELLVATRGRTVAAAGRTG